MSEVRNARRAWAAAAGCALLLTGVPASAQAPAPELFGTFKAVCADNGAVFARTTAAPEVQAWRVINFPLPLPTGGAKLRQKVIRVQGAGKGAMALFFAGAGDIPVGERRAPVQMCAVGVKPADKAQAIQRVQAWTGQPPQTGPKNSTSFRFHQTASGAKSPLGPGKLSDVAARLGPGSVVSVDIVPQAGTTVISYSIIQL